MIPDFPKFKKIELSDRIEIEKFTSKFPPYSDFNFVSMWSWNFHKKTKISKLNDNLVILFNDYLSGDIFLSFVGEKNIIETSSILIDFSKKKYNKNFLKFIPEELISHYKNSKFVVKSDRNSYDYIYLSEHLADMENWTKDNHSRKIKKFIQMHPNYLVKEFTLKNILQKEYKKMFEKWSQNKNIQIDFESSEYKAFKRFLGLNDNNIKFISIYINNELIGFSVYEFLSNNYAIAHFSKADIKNYPGIFDLLNLEEAKFLNAKGIKYLNWEQDLGLPGLRYSKEKYNPYFLMRKYIISKD